MRKIYVIPFLFVLILSIHSTAFEDDKDINNYKFLYKLKASFDDLVLNYCTTYDSYTINRLYSEKKINSINFKNRIKPNKILVKIKNKPLNPKIINKIQNKHELALSFKKEQNLFDTKNLTGKKKEFVEVLLPIISYENQKIIFDRENLKKIRQTLSYKKTLSKKNLIFLKKIAKNYKVKTNNKHKLDLVDELLDLVDVIPNSIVLAQAANESGWGTSRFAKDYNAFFGEYTYDFSKGVLPLDREEGKTHFVKAFSSSDKSVESYFRNINTHHAYKDFRLIRKLMREKNNFTDLNLLINTLDTYAEDEKYIETISSIIQSNKLFNFDILIFTLLKS